MNTDRITKNIKKYLKEDKILNVSLSQIDDDDNHTELMNWDLQEYDASNIGDLASEIYDTAQSLTDAMGQRMKFSMSGVDKKGRRHKVIFLRQDPEKFDQSIDATGEGQIALSMKQSETTFRLAIDALATQVSNYEKLSTMANDIMNTYHKRLLSLEKREDKAADIIREYRDYHADIEERHRREDRYDRLFELITGYLTPKAVEKLVEAGVMSPEIGASISAAGQEMQEEIQEEKQMKIKKEQQKKEQN